MKSFINSKSYPLARVLFALLLALGAAVPKTGFCETSDLKSLSPCSRLLIKNGLTLQELKMLREQLARYKFLLQSMTIVDTVAESREVVAEKIELEALAKQTEWLLQIAELLITRSHNPWPDTERSAWESELGDAVAQARQELESLDRIWQARAELPIPAQANPARPNFSVIVVEKDLFPLQHAHRKNFDALRESLEQRGWAQVELEWARAKQPFMPIAGTSDRTAIPFAFPHWYAVASVLPSGAIRIWGINKHEN